MCVLVCGGREFANRQLLTAALSWLRQERGIALVIAGGARAKWDQLMKWCRS